MVGDNRKLVVEIREESPNIPAIEISRRLGITRERVRQILKKEGLETRVPPIRRKYSCVKCEVEFIKTPNSYLYVQLQECLLEAQAFLPLLCGYILLAACAEILWPQEE